jgi:hypothetical protein
MFSLKLTEIVAAAVAARTIFRQDGYWWWWWTVIGGDKLPYTRLNSGGATVVSCKIRQIRQIHTFKNCKFAMNPSPDPSPPASRWRGENQGWCVVGIIAQKFGF